jgi:3-carboxy-cis,cis-muconate cycloisomerase
MLIAYRALAIVEDDLAALSARLAALADEHRDTLMPGRTLLQQALPITFGLKAAEWLAGVVRGRSSLRRVRDEALGAELGGAAGTLASLGDGGVTVLRAFAAEVRLREPAVPWHAERGSIAEIGSALALISGALDKIALDIILLAQSELSEVLPGGEGRQGGSSTLPHKRNPVAAVLTRACVRLAQAQSEVLERGMAHELERAAGAWQAEWPALSGALAYTGGAAQWLRQALDGLQVQRERMRANLDATDGLIMAERVSMALAERMGRDGAHDLVRRLTRHSAEEGKSLTDMLLGDPAVRAHLSKEEIEHAMDPAGYLGSANAFVDRALAAYEASL